MSRQIVNKDSISIPQGTMEDFNRPDHSDFKDRMELQKEKWSGVRANSISGDIEFWVLGEIKRACKSQEEILRAYQDIFGLYKTETLRGRRG